MGGVGPLGGFRPLNRLFLGPVDQAGRVYWVSPLAVADPAGLNGRQPPFSPVAKRFAQQSHVVRIQPHRPDVGTLPTRSTQKCLEPQFLQLK